MLSYDEGVGEPLKVCFWGFGGGGSYDAVCSSRFLLLSDLWRVTSDKGQGRRVFCLH